MHENPSSIPLDTLVRTLIAFAANPNFANSAADCGISRPTMRRYIKELERLSGAELTIRTSHSSHALTPYGERLALQGTEWLRAGHNLLTNAHGENVGQYRASIESPEGLLEIQQHPLSKIWEHESSLLSEGLMTWVASQGLLDASAMTTIREQSIVTRERRGEWLLMDVGAQSSLVQWIGLSRARAEIGLPVSLSSISTEGDVPITHAYEQAIRTGSALYDHVSATLPRKQRGKRFHVNYRRLALPGRLDNGDQAVLSLVERTDELVITGFVVPRVCQPGGE